jgi:hypothetical protein
MINELTKSDVQYLENIFNHFNGYLPLSFEQFIENSRKHISYYFVPFLIKSQLQKQHFNFINEYVPRVNKFLEENPDFNICCYLHVLIDISEYNEKILQSIHQFFEDNKDNLFHVIIACIIEYMITSDVCKADISDLQYLKFKPLEEFKFTINVHSKHYYSVFSFLFDRDYYQNYVDAISLKNDILFQYHQWVLQSLWRKYV